MIPTRDQIKSAQDLRLSDPIPVPEWGEGAVLYVQTVSGNDLSAWENFCAARRGKDKKISDSRGIKAALIVRAACDDQRRPVFSDEDVDWLGEKSGAVLGRLWDAACTINGIGEDTAKRLEKNSEATPTNSSGDS